VFREIQEVMELLESARVKGETLQAWLQENGVKNVEVTRVEGEEGFTEFVRATIVSPQRGGPTLGIIGRLGGVGARPHRLGLVSDADGAIVALACAAKLAKMAANGDALPGDVIVATHICPTAPIIPHEPASFMNSPVDIATMNRYEVDSAMDAILSIDTTKGNWIVIMRIVLNEPPVVLPITTQDITPYGNEIYHINSIVQPATATVAPVVGVATTASTPIPGSASGANQPFCLEMTARFCVEVAKAFTAGACCFYDENEFSRLVSLYGSMHHLQTLGKERG
jgi:hypothetical protein